jgi:hypothetical protein
VDVGALCLSSFKSILLLLFTEPDVTYSEKDRHKAPAHPFIHPLSLQDTGSFS